MPQLCAILPRRRRRDTERGTSLTALSPSPGLLREGLSLRLFLTGNVADFGFSFRSFASTYVYVYVCVCVSGITLVGQSKAMFPILAAAWFGSVQYFFSPCLGILSINPN